MAKYPENLVIGIFQQNDINDNECILNNLDLRGATIKIIKCTQTIIART